MIRLAAMACLVWSAGCAYRATVTTEPAGAVVFIDDQDVGMAPVPITIRRFFQAHSIRVELPGYRPYEIELTTEARLLPRLRFGVTHPLVMMGKRPPPLRTLMLIPEHGPAGTWTPEDVER